MVADLYVWWLLIWLLFSFVCLWVGFGYCVWLSCFDLLDLDFDCGL